jgi:hypothetical protein
MKKVAFLAFVVLVAVGFATAQNYVPHNNGGRGCAGCHAPHSGQGGSGGNYITGQTTDKTHSGDDFLFAQDMGPIYGLTLNMGDGGKYVETLPSTYSAGDEELRGIGACLACHDGAVARGAMMVGTSYEQRMGLLPSGVYGTQNGIPTLLGNDGYGTGYNNDHPVGKMATLGAAHVASNLTVTFNADGSIASIVPKAGSTYANFVADYGMPAIAGTPYGYGVAADGSSNANNLYLTCTTCHDQHVMNVYKGVGKGAANSYTSASDTGTYQTYFFVNAPYNISNFNQGGTSFTNKAPSATQFCRECHFGEANENYGLNLPTQW